MKQFTVPPDVASRQLQKGSVTFYELTSEVVLVRQAFRAAGNRTLTLELQDALEGKKAGDLVQLSDRALELLATEYELNGERPAHFLTRAIAIFQIALDGAEVVKE